MNSIERVDYFDVLDNLTFNAETTGFFGNIAF